MPRDVAVPGRVLVAWAVGACIIRFTGGKGRVGLVLKMDRMVVVQGEPIPVVLGHFTLRVELGQSCGPGLLPGRWVLVVGDVEQVHGPAGQKPSGAACARSCPAPPR